MLQPRKLKGNQNVLLAEATTEFQKKLDDYLRSDRQWLREHRIAHAEYQLSLVSSDDDKAFWQAVIKANTKPMEEKSGTIV